MRNNAGKLIWVSTSVELIHLENSLCTITSSIDITTHKLAQDTLLENKIRYHSLVTNLNVGVLVQGPNAEMILSNPRALELLGLTEEQLTGKSSFDPYWNVIHEDGSPFPGHTHPVPVSIATGQPVINVVMGVFRPLLNDRVWLLVNADPQLREDGSIREVICTFKDISALINVTEELKNKKQRLSAILEGTNIGTWEWNIQTGETIFNDRSAELLGYSLEEISPKTIETWMKLKHPEDIEISNLLLQNHFNGELNYYDCEVRMKHKNGNWVWVLDRGRVYERDASGQPLKMSGTHQDISQHKQEEYDKAERIKELKGLFGVADIISKHTFDVDDTLNKIVNIISHSWQFPENTAAIITLKEKKYSTSNFKETQWKLSSHIINIDKVVGSIDVYYLIEYPKAFEGPFLSEERQLIDSMALQIGQFIEKKSNENERKKIRENLQLGEKIARIGYWELNLVEKNIYSSEGAREIYGTDKKIMTFEELKRFRLPEYDSYLDNALRDLLFHNKPYNVEYKIKRESDGKIIDIYSKSTLNHESNIIFGTIQDISERKSIEVELENNNIRLTQAMQLAKMAWWSMDIITGKIIFDENKIKSLGFNPKHFTHFTHFTALIHPDDYEIMMSALQNHYTGIERKYVAEYRIKCKSGKYKWLNDIGSIDKRNKDGTPTNISGLSMDISERKKAEEKEVKLSRIHKFTSKINELILYNSDESTLFNDACHAAVTFGNFRMAWIGLVDKITNNVIPVAHSGHYGDYLDKININANEQDANGRGPSGNAIRNKNYSVCNDIENDPMMAPWKTTAIAHEFHSCISFPIFKNNDTIGVFNLYASVPDYFNNEEITLIENVTRNLSFAVESIDKEVLRKKYLDQIASDDQVIRTLSLAIEQSPIVTIITDLEGNIIFVNPRFTEITGYTSEEVIGKNPRILKSGNTHHSEYKTLWNTIKNGDIWNGTFLNKKKNGEYYWESTIISPVKNNTGAITHYLAIKEDISNLKIAEAEKSSIIEDLIQHNKNLEQFAYIVSHNLRTSVANIIGLNNLFKLKNTDANDKEVYQFQIIKSVEKLDDVIKDLNTILQVKNQLNSKVETVNFEEIINSIIVGLGSLIKSENITFKLNFKEAEKIESIRSFIYSIFFNLISNSIKYRSLRSPIIEITTRIVGDKLLILYKDNGMGIDLAAHGQNLFGLYKRFHSEHAEGKGVGLYMVKTQIESLGGKISVSSQPDKGVEFTIELRYNKKNTDE